MTRTFPKITENEINEVMSKAAHAFKEYKKTSARQKALFLDTIASEIESLGDALIAMASEETNLPRLRLIGERARTCMQLRMFAEMLREGSWVDATIDTATPSRVPLPKQDIRKMLFPLGPVVVFGASNFPFAYSTAGGDTSSALAAGCPVIVKAHPAHAQTSESVYHAIVSAIKKCNMPEFIFQHVHGADIETGKALVEHSLTAAVGFTGSLAGGRALYDYAAKRQHPIPVFAEMGSVNPVLLLPQALEQQGSELAKLYANSITLGMGQFCTNPGIMIAVKSEALDKFCHSLATEIAAIEPAKMLHQGIHKSYLERMQKALVQENVVLLKQSSKDTGEMEALPTIATIEGASFLANPYLHEEVFGPYSLLIVCKDMDELMNAWISLQGQLTTTIMATSEELEKHPHLLEVASQIAGRVVLNSVPTGVEVCPAMMHGGPYPACTDSRFSAVGIHAVKRWVRPICFQNFPEHLLPIELRNDNPGKIMRLLNNTFSNEKV